MKQQIADDQVQLIGVIQEQHPDRCRLFAQWQKFDWPIVHDPVNVIATRAVPVVLAIDEHGVVQSKRPRQNWVINEFLKTDYPAPKAETVAPIQLTTQQRQIIWGSAVYHRAERRAGPKPTINPAEFFDRAIGETSDDATVAFATGVAYRMRYESNRRQPGDFEAAVAHWSRALELDPNHYIYRRRIQQYGPRLMKPYPFYDWVEQARTEIKERGETPVQLFVEPGGAEFAKPSRSFVGAVATTNPDPDGKITRDESKFVGISGVAVPTAVKPGSTMRFHIELRPNKAAHWNNEADPVQVWVNQPDGWELSRDQFSLKQPPQPETSESRRLEFEVKAPKNAKPTKLQGFALYYVCEDEGGQCLYRRQDFELQIAVKD